jgi:hypothetical protein
MSNQTQVFVPAAAGAKMFLPTNDLLGLTWTQPAFKDSTWTPVTLGVGYDRPPSGQTNSTIEPDDVTRPGDAIAPTSNNSPGNEGAENAIDNSTATKYLNFDKLNAGVTITPFAGDTVVVGLRLTSANDAPERDPTSFVLSGSRDGNSFTEIARGSIPDFTARFYTVEVSFTNTAAYLHYRLLFPTVRNAAAANSVQISEVELLGYFGAPPPDYRELIREEVEGIMFGRRTSACLRIPFTVQELQPRDRLALWAHYDDGFVAFLNGVMVVGTNAPQSLAWNSAALTDRSRTNALREQRFDLSSYANLLVPGSSNVLAVQALNDRADSPDFLMRARLENTELTLGQAGYMTVPTPGAQNGTADLGLVADPVADRERGFHSAPFQVALTCPTAGATIRFTTNGSTPTLTNGTSYVAPITIQRTTTLRFAAFRDGWRSSRVVTHTYLFLADVVTQNYAQAVAAGFPTNWDTQAADYGLDPRVVGSNGQDDYGGKYTASFPNDLRSLPTMSLVMDINDLFGTNGIYSHPNNRGDAWERPASMELIHTNGQAGVHANVGLRIQGGAFRQFNLTLKKSFRVVFREEYGEGRLHYALFGPNAADEFNNFVLRANSNDAWPYSGAGAVYVRDTFADESARAMGMVAPHANFVHLYINGQYWGLYNPTERPDAVFSATYHGGEDENWDAINQDSAPDGNYDAWNRLMALTSQNWSDNAVYQRAQGNNPDGTHNPNYENLLDVENMIDYMILNFYIGNGDWPGRNYWVGRDRTGTDGFQFYPWDSETSLSGVGSDVTGVSSAVARPYAAARANAEFRMRFADRVYHHFFNSGAFYVNPAAPAWNPATPQNNRPAARFAALAEQVRQGIVGESARWGDQLRTSPYTRDEHWQTARNGLLASYFPARSAALLEIFRNAGLFPRVDAPSFNHQGGSVAPGSSLIMSATQGIIYYTTDGTDPRTPIEIEELNRRAPVASNTLRRVLVPSTTNGGSTLDTLWRNVGFNDSSWTSGYGGVGFDTAPDYRPFIGVDVDASMRNRNNSVFIRIPFTGSTNQLNYMVLRMRYDDGFAAFLNGQLIASANTPDPLRWDSFATAGNADTAAVQFRDFDVSQFVNALLPGENVLAIQGLNASLASSDFLIDTELIVAHRRIVGGLPTARVYTGPIPLTDLAHIRARVLIGTEWSALHEASFVVGTPELVISEVHYHPANLSAQEWLAGFTNENDFEFVELCNVGTATFDLNGVRFTDGIDFNFTGSAIPQLPPGACVLVVPNRAAFEFRYGVGFPIAGQYSGRLSNSGEHLELVDIASNIIAELTYGIVDPWPALANGGGPSLELREFSGDRGAPAQWQASQAIGGSPGLPVSVVLRIVLEADRVRLQWPGAYVAARVESAPSLPGWIALTNAPTVENGSCTIRLPLTGGGRFFRLRLH